MGKFDKDVEAQKPRPKSRNEIFTEQLRRKFMKLPMEKREFIRKAQEEGLEWRGEDIQTKYKQLDGLTHFEHVYREWKLMKEIGIVAYRKRALDKMDAFTKRSVVSTGRQ